MAPRADVWSIQIVIPPGFKGKGSGKTRFLGGAPSFPGADLAFGVPPWDFWGVNSHNPLKYPG